MFFKTRRHILVPLSVIALIGVVSLFIWLRTPIDAVPYLALEPSPEMQDRNGRLLYPFPNAAGAWCFPRELEQISPRFLAAIVAAEDQRFAEHPGVDLLAVARAIGQNIRHMRVKSGASTLTMQVVKRTRDGRPTMLTKAGEMLRALRLEHSASKNEILRAYVNGVPFGLNSIGCEAAARRYFGKTAKELTLAEAALLAGLPKAPSLFMPLAHPQRALERRDYVLGRMRAGGMISHEEYQAAVKEPLSVQRHEFPRYAPHLAQRLRPNTALRTTLDFSLQDRVEQTVARHVARFSPGISNGAAIVVDVRSGEILARVGSAGFFTAPSGQVDICRAPRSPGSALKPFAYALALEMSLLYPTELLLDNTLDYGRYQPVNFDGRKRGLITADAALRHSLNIPAVLVTNRVGVPGFYRLLKDLGLSTLTRRPEEYGLGLVIGNCEVRLEEAAAAYTALARLGLYRPLTTVLGAATEEHRVLSRGVCLALFDMLEQPFPGMLDKSLVPAGFAPPRVCWKTGTSTGLHDAWAFMFNDSRVVGVWMGNSDGKSSRQLVGAYAALPLAAEIFLSVVDSNSATWPAAGDDLRTVVVCAVSGLPVSTSCPVTRNARVPREELLQRTCALHRPDSAIAWGNANGGIRETWPASANDWDLAKLRGSASAGANGETTEGAVRDEALRILAPANDAKYVLTGETNADRIRLETSLDAEGGLHWYLDERYLGTSSVDQPRFLPLSVGQHKLTCLGPNGAIHSVRFEVSALSR